MTAKRKDSDGESLAHDYLMRQYLIQVMEALAAGELAAFEAMILIILLRAPTWAELVCVCEMIFHGYVLAAVSDT
jgi:hypothetical protein